MNLNAVYLIFGLLQLYLSSTDSSTISDKEQQAPQIDFIDNTMLRDSNNNYNNKNNFKDKTNNNNNNNKNNNNNLSPNGEISMTTGSTDNVHHQTHNEEEDKLVNVSDNYNDDSNNVNYDDNNSNNNDISTLSLNDQVRLLSKQLNALTMRRREDYKLLENSLKKSLRKSMSAGNNVDVDIRGELEQLREEVRMLREGSIGNKERLTVEWLAQSIAEMRKELTELQEMANNASKDLTRRNQIFKDIATITSDFSTFRSELEDLKQRQERTEVFVRELRDEAVQKEEELQKMITQRDQDSDKSPAEYSEPETDHRMRHHRILRQQIHDLEVTQKRLKHQLNELQYHRINERVRNLEVEQHRIANANFNLSRQIAGLDKLHGSMLELLEDVEGIQNKVDKSIPDIKREISKLEFTSAQLNSEQSLLREEGHNAAKSIQAMAVSVSVLQDERDNIKNIQSTIEKLQDDVQRLQSTGNVHTKSTVHHHIDKIESESKTSNQTSEPENNNVRAASNLVRQLESVELQYESIINKLPEDCSQVDHTSTGLYLIAPVGQHRPTLVTCNNGWTLIQRRYDGSVDFNRSWESYAQGFGGPSGEFWIGNDILHHLTSDNCTELKIIMQDIYDNTWYASYSKFYISERNDGYRLHISGYSGNASDALDYQNRMQFSAIDVDRDISNTHCAANYEGGWWFSHCQHANLNGRYNLGLTWFDASRNEWIAVKSSQMMINKNMKCLNMLTTDRTTTIISTVV